MADSVKNETLHRFQKTSLQDKTSVAHYNSLKNGFGKSKNYRQVMGFDTFCGFKYTINAGHYSLRNSRIESSDSLFGTVPVHMLTHTVANKTKSFIQQAFSLHHFWYENPVSWVIHNVIESLNFGVLDLIKIWIWIIPFFKKYFESSSNQMFIFFNFSNPNPTQNQIKYKSFF